MFYFLQYFLSIDSSIFLTEKFYEYFFFWLAGYCYINRGYYFYSL